MRQHHTRPDEDAVLAVLGGVPLEKAAQRVPTSALRLAEAVERYRAAGRAALDHPTAGWYQTHITFADYSSAARAFRAYLLPAMQSEAVGAWWFLRKHPCWRLRVRPALGAPAEEAVEHTVLALDSAVSWGVVKEWRPSLYEPEIIAFGGAEGMTISERIFHADSAGVLTYDQLTDDPPKGLLDAKATSLSMLTLFLRAAGLEWAEQGDVWGQVEAKRTLPADVPLDRVGGLVNPMRQLLTLDPAPALADGPLRPVAAWVDGMERGGRDLRIVAEANRLGLGLRCVLARHVIFHWNRMGFSTRQQAIWARAAREAVLGA
ncbi:thiopeptide-type bacteriocin biosynthesis protein [Streptomyces echinatus]|uniref:thiopeptide-type bacteriocin biosynthesis protein n=1 Tax=Streptomyces echinatus TaxID=67293 RepID=UPI0037B7E7AE